MSYPTGILDLLADMSELAIELSDKQPADALAHALDVMQGNATDVVKGKRTGEWTTEQVDAYRDQLAVVRDVRNEFVSPTIGNVRDYVLARVSTKAGA